MAVSFSVDWQVNDASRVSNTFYADLQHTQSMRRTLQHSDDSLLFPFDDMAEELLGREIQVSNATVHSTTSSSPPEWPSLQERPVTM